MEFFYIYSRKEAIADGVLIDVSDAARSAGFRYPVALTRAAWSKCVEVPAGAEHHQDEEGRLSDVLMLAYFGARAHPDSDEFRFRLDVHDGEGLETAELKVCCGPGDDLEPVITVMLPDED